MLAVAIVRKRYLRMCETAFKHYLETYKTVGARDALEFNLHNKGEKEAERFPAELANMLPKNIDLVFSGGGFKNCYSCGVCMVVEALQRRCGGPTIHRFAGASAGAHMSAISYNNWYNQGLTWAMSVASTLKKYPLSPPHPMWDHFYNKISKENPLPPPDKLNISITSVAPMDCLTNHVISNFENQGELADALLASGGIPLVLSPGLCRWFRKKPYIDGGVTNNCPMFQDGLRPQLVVRFNGLPTHLREKVVYFTRQEMIDLIYMGMEDAVEYLTYFAKTKAGTLEPEAPEVQSDTDTGTKSPNLKRTARARANLQMHYCAKGQTHTALEKDNLSKYL